jgi:hypothetical protein
MQKSPRSSEAASRMMEGPAVRAVNLADGMREWLVS